MVERDRDSKSAQKREGWGGREGSEASSTAPANSTGGHFAVNEVSATAGPGSALTPTNDKSALAL